MPVAHGVLAAEPAGRKAGSRSGSDASSVAVAGAGGLGAGMLELHLAYRTGKGLGHLGEVARRPGQDRDREHR
ncbi:hypothetical protein [Streptomyces cucumeris]|uniref:hypothetical protein n=1 Tax=Streptomyces cucumeris TaxID=2962890 RepID=UPI0020C930F8|nr:hypothetical protein [Streptomyces sp. NEAU-Y11]MCP9212403.1 hypothetical protein [Streptomyces sp. NEAU-Y11]